MPATDPQGELPESVRRAWGVQPVRALGGRASRNWEVRRGADRLVVRATGRAPWQTSSEHARAVGWRSRVQDRVRQLGWPAAGPIRSPLQHGDDWWALEEALPGKSAAIPAGRQVELLASFHRLGADLTGLGPQPGRLDPLAVLSDPDAEADLRLCPDPDDRSWLLRRLTEARQLAGVIDWSASPRVLVHGDFAPHNLLFEGHRLTGLLDVELATVDRRVVDLIHVWRCRYDDRVLAWHALEPLGADEWRMMLVDWWALMVSLALVNLRRGVPPDPWELAGLRRTTPLAERVAAGQPPG